MIGVFVGGGTRVSVGTGMAVCSWVGAPVGGGRCVSVAVGRLVGGGVSVADGRLVGTSVSVADGRLVGRGVSGDGWVGRGAVGGREDGTGNGVLILGTFLKGTNSCCPIMIRSPFSKQFASCNAPTLTP